MSDERNKKTDWPAILFLLVGLPVAFMYGGIWVGLIALVIGVIVLGWNKRHEGPFPTNTVEKPSGRTAKGPSPALQDWLEKRRAWEMARKEAEAHYYETIIARGGHVSMSRTHPYDPQKLQEPLRTEAIEYLRLHDK